ncbi:hypothetical protein HJC23_006049 [Cyclotella cryptica]|uniref:peptide-methionine (S)-S-oxide reductase n=1 Tax=Cyclotella cryptica TaxID=29204 RepID=A0ABD3PT83_9STRA|eukprot:CCRYP_011349-RD/>CCRYP_011349-RD protein AED:0.14 eAED:0.14 QI:301/1/1/1/0.33/0.25/4/1441/422
MMHLLPSCLLLVMYLCCLTTAWQITPNNHIHRSWQLLVNIGSLHQSSSLFLSAASSGPNDGQECGAATPLTTNNNGASQDLSNLAAPETLHRKPRAGDIVTFTLLRFQPIVNKENASTNHDMKPLFDTSGTLQLILHDGHHLPELHTLLSTMTPGETVRRAVIDGGHGPYRPELQFVLPIAQMGKSIDASLIKVGTELQLGEMTCRVVAVNEEEWICDANHVLAGVSYEVDVTLERVEGGIQEWGFVEKEDLGVNGRFRVGTFALGCFWGGELAYQRMPGVISTHVGYTQGHLPNPTYEEVCTGTTGHAEAIRLVYDPSIVSYRSLVQLGLDRLGDNVYKLNQVGNDRGTQYRHGFYYHDEEQREVVMEMLASLNVSDGKKVMTEVKKAQEFYMAEDYHQQYLFKGGQSAKKGSDETIRCYG